MEKIKSVSIVLGFCLIVIGLIVILIGQPLGWIIFLFGLFAVIFRIFFHLKEKSERSWVTDTTNKLILNCILFIIALLFLDYFVFGWDIEKIFIGIIAATIAIVLMYLYLRFFALKQMQKSHEQKTYVQKSPASTIIGFFGAFLISVGIIFLIVYFIRPPLIPYQIIIATIFFILGFILIYYREHA